MANFQIVRASKAYKTYTFYWLRSKFDFSPQFTITHILEIFLYGICGSAFHLPILTILYILSAPFVLLSAGLCTSFLA